MNHSTISVKQGQSRENEQVKDELAVAVLESLSERIVTMQETIEGMRSTPWDHFLFKGYHFMFLVND